MPLGSRPVSNVQPARDAQNRMILLAERSHTTRLDQQIVSDLISY